MTEAPRPTATPAWTPLPTLAPPEAEALVSNLLDTNGGCRLPCWWGITPGQPFGATTQQAWSSFATRLEIGHHRVVTAAGEAYRSNSVDFFYSSDSSDLSIYVGINWRDELSTEVTEDAISLIFVSSDETRRHFQLHELLSEYGVPGDVLLYTNINVPYEPGEQLPFRLAVFYPDQGIVAEYEYHLGVTGDTFLGCPEPIGPRLRLWSPAERTVTTADVDDFVMGLREDDALRMRSLDEVTNLDLVTITRLFSDPANSACIETPEDVWP